MLLWKEAINGGGFFMSPRDFYRLLFGKPDSDKDPQALGLVS
jgi:hypothetical protein